MIKIALTFMLVITSMSSFAVGMTNTGKEQSPPPKDASTISSGSDTVFKKIDRFYLTNDITQAYATPDLARNLERLQLDVLIIKVPKSIYAEIASYVFWGYIVTAELDGNIELDFIWEPTLEAIVGYSSHSDDLYILSL